MKRAPPATTKPSSILASVIHCMGANRGGKLRVDALSTIDSMNSSWRFPILRRFACSAVLICLYCDNIAEAKEPRHYIFFGADRDRIRDKSFLETPAIEGAQLRYTWRELEPEKDVYDFSAIRHALAFLASHGKKLFIQLQDVSFYPSIVNVPRYLLRDGDYNGGANQQYNEEKSAGEGWVARRWDPAVQERFHKLIAALGKEFDGHIEGINLPETSIGFGKSARMFPKGFSYEAYRDATIENMRALKRAFPKSVAMQYANFMPGEWLPGDDKGYLKAVYNAARESNIGVGGPDLLPFRRPQLNHAYPLIRAAAGIVPTGIAVQDGNYESQNPSTRKRATVPELKKFAEESLQVDYIFWCTEEPFYTKEVIPFLSAVDVNTPSRARRGDRDAVR